MRKIIVHEFITLDGVIQAPVGEDEDTDGGFVHGGWTFPYWHDDVGKFFFDEIRQADTMLLGRKTWQIHGDAFNPLPAGDPFADVLNGIPKVVVSTTLQSTAAWQNSTLISRDIVEEVRQLKDVPGKNILIDGSSMLIHTLAKDDLVDEYCLHVYPLVLGGGKCLFPEGVRIDLELIETRSLPTGVVFQRYQAAK